MSGEYFNCYKLVNNWGEKTEEVATGNYWMLNILHSTGQPLEQRLLTPQVNSTEVEILCTKYFSTWILRCQMTNIFHLLCQLQLLSINWRPMLGTKSSRNVSSFLRERGTVLPRICSLINIIFNLMWWLFHNVEVRDC